MRVEDCPERKTFLKKIEQLMKKLLPYMPVDAACDQMSKQFIHDSLPPVITEGKSLPCPVGAHLKDRQIFPLPPVKI